MKNSLNILVPTDYSKESQHVLEYAIHISEKLPSEIFLLHTYQLPVYPQEMPTQAMGIELKDIEDEANSKMDALLKWAKQSYPKATITSIVDYGPAETKIDEIITDKNIDLLILGFKGGSGAKVFLFGSISADSIGKIGCPIIIVPDDFKGNEIKNIVFATSWIEQDDINGIKNLLPWAKAFEAKVTAVHIFSSKEFYSREERYRYEAKVREVVKYNHLEFKLIEGDDFTETMHKFLKKENADMLVMVTHPRFLLEGLYHPSLTKKVLRHADVPLLVFL